MKENNSINVRIFYALKIAEKSNVPLLLMSNPGTGKTTTIMMYGKLRNMDVVCLQGNAEDAEAIHGYETVPSSTVVPGEAIVSTRTRPSWMNRILKNQKEGKRTILFLDEITTANECVQSALLKLIFDRMCGIEKLPPKEECLIVSAGNYVNNLSSSMTILAPLMNRFMIYNITPTANDLVYFLNKYTGALSTGKIEDPMVELENNLRELDSQETHYDEATLGKIGEYFERSILETARMLATKAGKVDLSITDLRNIYGDVDDTDPNLYGFLTPRSLVYLRDVTIACYVSFGEAGIKSDNFKQMINGLCGIGLEKEIKSGNNVIIKVNKIGGEFYTSLVQISSELSKLSSSALPEYISYFTDLVKPTSDSKKSSKVLSPAELTALKNKIESMNGDSMIEKLKKPLEPELIRNLGTVLVNTSKGIPIAPAPKTGEDILKKMEESGLTVTTLSEHITLWNSICEAYNSLYSFISTEKWEYESTMKDDIEKKFGKQLSTVAIKLKVYSRAFSTLSPGTANLIPLVKPIMS